MALNRAIRAVIFQVITSETWAVTAEAKTGFGHRSRISLQRSDDRDLGPIWIRVPEGSKALKLAVSGRWFSISYCLQTPCLGGDARQLD